MTDATKALGVADIQKIMACIPHRYPFLLVDKVVEIDEDLMKKRAQSKSAYETMIAAARARPKPARAPRQPRHGFQDAPRLPCYRGVRAR